MRCKMLLLLTIIITIFSTNLAYANNSSTGPDSIINVTATQELLDVLVEPSSVSISSGKTQAVKIFAVYSDYSKVDVTKSVTLVSDDDSIAIEDGALIKGVSQGETTVSGAFRDWPVEITVDVTQPVKKLSADPSTLNLSTDEQSDPITLEAIFTDGTPEDVSAAAIWTSSNPSVATVDVDVAGGSVTVTGVTEGPANITGSYGSKTVIIKVNVIPELVNLMIQPESVSVVKGKIQAVKIYGVYSDDIKKDVSKLVKLESDNKSIATVIGGKIKGIGIGETIISATYNDLYIEIVVKVTPPLKSISVDPLTLNLSTDEQSDLITLMATFTDGTSEDITAAATWTSAKPGIATIVVKDGIATVTGVTEGSTSITGSCGGKKVTVKVNVTD